MRHELTAEARQQLPIPDGAAEFATFIGDIPEDDSAPREPHATRCHVHLKGLLLPFGREVAESSTLSLIEEFGSLGAALAASPSRRRAVLHDRLAVSRHLGVVRAPMMPRPIVHRALDLGASGLVLVHNHPSGNAEPSTADIAATRELVSACRLLEIVVHDHLIVARSGWTSLRLKGLM